MKFLFFTITRRKALGFIRRESSLFPATRRCTIFAMLGGNNFGHNGKRHFFWRSSSNIQANGAVNAGNLFIRQPLLLETFIALFTSFAAADGANVSYLP